jgi:hypothetical protein
VIGVTGVPDAIEEDRMGSIAELCNVVNIDSSIRPDSCNGVIDKLAINPS